MGVVGVGCVVGRDEGKSMLSMSMLVEVKIGHRMNG